MLSAVESKRRIGKRAEKSNRKPEQSGEEVFHARKNPRGDLRYAICDLRVMRWSDNARINRVS